MEEDTCTNDDGCKTDAQKNKESHGDTAEKEDADRYRVISVDKVTVEKYVLESNGSREVFLTKNESSRRLSAESEPGTTIRKRLTDENKQSSIKRCYSVTVPEGSSVTRFTGAELKSGTSVDEKSETPISNNQHDNSSGSTTNKRIKPIKFTKPSSVGSLAVDSDKCLESLNTPKDTSKTLSTVPDEPNIKKLPHPRKELSSSSSVHVEVSPQVVVSSEIQTNEVNEKLVESETTNVSIECKTSTIVPDNNAQTNKNKSSLGAYTQHKELTFKNKECVAEETNIENSTDSQGRKKLDIDVQDLLEKSQSKIEDLQQNLGTKIHASTAQSYKEELLGLRSALVSKISAPTSCTTSEEGSSNVIFDKDFIEKHNFDKSLKIEERKLLETDLDYVPDSGTTPVIIGEYLDKIIPKVKPRYSEKVSEVEKRWSGDFLRNRLNRHSSESSKSSYVEEFGSTSSHESIGEDNRIAFTTGYEHPSFAEEKSTTDEDKIRASEEALGNSTVSTFDSDSCLEDKIRAADEVIENITVDVLKPGYHPGTRNLKVESNEEELEDCDTPRKDLQEENTGNNSPPNFVVRTAGEEDSFESTFILRGRSRRDGYASLIKEFTMEAGSSRLKKDEKQKKKLGFRRLLPGFFSPKDSRKEYSKKELKERKKHDDKHFAKYQQNGNYTRSPDTMNLNEDIKRNVKLDTSLNGSIIEERLDEIKRELFPEQGLVTSTPDHFLQADDRGHFFDRSKNSRCCTTDSSLSSIAPDDRWIDQNISLNGGPDIRRYEQKQKRDEHSQRRYGQLERKHSLQEPNNGNRNLFFVRNHGPSGRISAPPSERFLLRSRAIHPVDRPLPAIPHSKVDLSNYENYCEDTHYLNQPGLYENGSRQHIDTSDLILTPVSAQVKITRQPIINQNQKALLVGRSPKYPSSGSSQKSGDYADSSCTPNSSQKSEFSPTSSKSGEYYLNSPRTSARGSPNDRGFGDSHADEIYEDEDPGAQSRMLERFVKDRIYDETPTSSSHLSESHMEKYSLSPYQEKYSNSHEEKYFHVSQHQKHSPTSQQQKCSPGSQQEKRSLDPHQGKHFSRSHVEKYSPKSYREKCSPNSHKEKHAIGTKVYRTDEEFIYNQKNASDCSRSSNEFIESTSVLNNNVQKLQADYPETDGVPKTTSPDKSTTPLCQPQNAENVKILPPTSPLQCRTESSKGFRVSTPSRKSQPNDQILIASPKRETFFESRVQRSLKETDRVRPESPVPTSNPTDQISSIASTDHKNRTLPANQSMERCSSKSEVTTTNPCSHVSKLETHRSESTGRRVVSPVNCSPDSYTTVDIQRPEPIYGTRKQPCLPISECVERISSIGSADGNSQTNYVSRKQSSVNIPRTNERSTMSPLTGFHATNEISSTNCNELNVSPNKSSSTFSPVKEIHRSDPIYGSCRQRVQEDVSSKSPEVRNDNRNQSPSTNNYQPPREAYTNEETVVWVQDENIRTSPRERFNAQNEKLSNMSLVESARANKSLGRCPVREQSPSQVQAARIHYQKDSILQKSNSLIPRSNSQQSNTPASQEMLYSSQSSVQRDPIYEQQQELQGKHLRSSNDPGRVQRSSDSLYCQHPPLTNQGSSQCGSHSPTKKQTMQHLEAFYWQQKALEVQRKSSASPANVNHRQDITSMPGVREVIYWQHLKKLNEEQQRKIYEQNAFEENGHEHNTSRGTPKNSPASIPLAMDHEPRMTSSNRSIQQSASNSRMHSNHADRPYWSSQMQRSKVSPAGKPPLIHGQKGPNQPVLIVRPQQAIRQRHEIPSNKTDAVDFNNHDAIRSKSASPPFNRNDSERLSYNGHKKIVTDSLTGTVVNLRKPEVSSICEDRLNEGERKQAPPPIFKRGSLVSGESVEYGSTGPKRVSFSNQANVGEDVTTGNWPTKRGTAPEPPTRRHRSEDSDTDSVFYHSDNRQPQQESFYGNSVQHDKSIEQDYDANKPLPPPPKEFSRSSPHDNNSASKNTTPEVRWNADADSRCSVNQTNYRKLPPGVCESESGSEAAGEIQKILRPLQEEEWNPNGKGRQANDSGGSGRAEGEPGSNELSSSGRRGGGGGGGGGGSGSGGGVLGVGGVGRSGGGGRSRDEPRRHTLGGDHQPSLHHQQFNASQQLHPLHPHHLPPPHGQYGTPPARHTTMDLEMGTKSRQRKSPLPRGYPPPSTAMLFDDDPGIMSEVETSSTGFRRGGKQRSSLPVVRTPSKTLERPLGLVFLQYRNETKRALLPNEITSIDTVKALFVRSFPKQLTMEYLDSPHVKVYIHDSNKDMFYELEDLRSHLRDIRDRSVLRLFESSDGVTGMPGPLGIPGGGAGLPPHWEDQSYFSEPEFDSEYQHQHIHKSKTAKNSTSSGGGYYVGGSSTLPRGGPLLRAYSPAASSVVAGPNATPTQPKTLATPGGGGVPPAKPLRSYQCVKSPPGSLGGSARFSRDSSVSLYSIPDRLHGESGYMSSPERGGGVGSAAGRYPPGPYSAGSSYEDPYYSQYSGTVTPVIDEEASDTELLEESYSLYGVKPPGRPPSGPPRSPFPPGAPAPLPPGGQSYDVTRIRVEHMERQLANLTGLVQKALTHAPHTSPSPRDYLQVPAGRDPYARSAGAGDEFDKHSSSSSASLPDDSYLRTDVKPPKLGKDKSVSFEKSVSFSDEPPDMNSPKQHSPQHAADTKPAKPAIKSSTLPRMSSQERDRHKPTPPPKPAALVAGQYVYRDLALTPEMYNQLRGLQKKAKDLRQEVRNLRRMSQTQAHTVRETIRDTFITIRAMLLSGVDATWMSGDAEKVRLSREEDLYKQEMIRLEKDLTELESTVEELRGNVINRKTRVNMSDVEKMALILSKSSKTVADLKVRFPSLQEGMKGLLSSEMEKVVREEKFLKEEPERLESALRRCKKLTGTLVTLKRLASVQEQRLPNASSVDAEETPPITPTSAQHSKTVTPVPAERTVVGSASVLGGGPHAHEPSAAHQQRPENALDALLDELQTFSRPNSQLGHSSGTPSHLSDIGRSASREVVMQQPLVTTASSGTRPPSMSDIGRKSSVDSSSGMLSSSMISLPGQGGTLRRLHSYPSSSDTDTSPPIARLQVSLQDQSGIPALPAALPGQKPPVPERNAELLQLASARRVPPPPPPRTSSRSPLASPTSPQLPPRNPCGIQNNNSTLRRPAVRGSIAGKECKPPMALPPDATALLPTDAPISGLVPHNSSSSQSSAVLSTSNSSSCESVNSQEGLQSKRGRQEQLEQRHQELLRKQKALQEQYARLQQLQRNAAGLTTVPPTPPDLLKKTGSESNLLAKMGLGMSTASSGSLTSLSIKPPQPQEPSSEDEISSKSGVADGPATAALAGTITNTVTTVTTSNQAPDCLANATMDMLNNSNVPPSSGITAMSTSATTTTTSKIYETDIL